MFLHKPSYEFDIFDWRIFHFHAFFVNNVHVSKRKSFLQYGTLNMSDDVRFKCTLDVSRKKVR